MQLTGGSCDCIFVSMQEMFEYFDEYNARFENPEMVALAIFFHDLIYDGKPREDENKSAEVWKQFGEEIGVPKEQIDSVYDWIVRTADHKCNASDSYDCRLFMDIDLAILVSKEKES